MTSFVSGIVTSNEEGAKYEDIVRTRFLAMRTDNGVELSVFDPLGPISNDLPIGAHCACILVTFPMSVLYFVGQPAPPPRAGFWQATLLDPHWHAPQGSFSHFSEQLYEHDWLLLATPLGQLLMYPKELKNVESIDANGIIQWENKRLDLLAVL